MNKLEKSQQFDTWLKSLKDQKGKLRILYRLTAAEQGNFGDVEPAGEGVSEMRIHYGPGYRIYYTRKGATIYLLLIGGDKSTQKRDIKRAIEMSRNIGKAGK
ncbi:putative addiction module killer protein [Ochrobactrum anthropi]|uniref:type II toxin-antitoxin system RelE/ParE family toxin n=1 Tax=Brucella anthropi TaxID=529 RepID=UPI0015FD9418|nr:type II toxin-antitoxin system RelE/ParE family toxin [Brucella anthropi]MBA8862748.1 putative addiction module killer protein [Brucella anthropi]